VANRTPIAVSLLGLWLMLPTAPAAGQDAVIRPAPIPHTYALLIGSNPGGAGQNPLRYAEEDARRMAEVLEQVGRFSAAQVEVLLRPSPSEVLQALHGLGQTLAAHRAQGEQAQFVFYYSGHARANAIQLGSAELPLNELRQRILELPTTLTLIVLDACQSGAFSQVKGAQPRAAFSYNSVARLHTSGVAVMASSSASELSQESEALRGSYFTHNLMVGLRGAGDRNRNGVVSLAEAYGYAYDRTLAETARTAVGQQHVSLETELTGQGEVPLSYPAQAGAQLELPAALEADVLLQRDDVVLAELHKARDSSLRLALPAGKLVAVLRQDGALSECSLQLQEGQVTRLAPAACHALDEVDARSKGYAALVPEAATLEREAWSVELQIGLGGSKKDAYTQRLEDFGFADTSDIFGTDNVLRLQLAIARQLGPHFSVLTSVRNYDSGRYERDLQSTHDTRITERFTWTSYALQLQLRVHSDAFHQTLRLYAQLGGGLGLVHSQLVSTIENDFGPVLSGAAGLFYMPFRPFGFVFEAAYAYAPVLHNELGDHHDSGGLSLAIGLRYRTWSSP
jgi:hypothetical protein